MTTNRSNIELTVTARQSVTLLPRCLQILSRRGYIVLHLTTKDIDEKIVALNMTVSGEQRWHAAMPHLLGKLVEVEDVVMEEI